MSLPPKRGTLNGADQLTLGQFNTLSTSGHIMLPDSYQNKNKAYRCRPTKDAPEEEQDGDNRPDKGASNSKPQETKDKAEQPEPEGNKTASADLQHTATVYNAVKIFIIIKNICH